jgi:TDG/mug DNA glycosylase family protein
MQPTEPPSYRSPRRGEQPGDTEAGLPDLLGPGLDIVFCGINPGPRAAASGHHFEGRGNRFWRVLHLAGFTPALMTPAQAPLLVGQGFGLTTAVARGTARASDVAAHEFAAAADDFVAKMLACHPRRIAFLGKAAHAGMTGRKHVEWGLQAARFACAETWVLPNPSGRQADARARRGGDAEDLGALFHQHRLAPRRLRAGAVARHHHLQAAHARIGRGAQHALVAGHAGHDQPVHAQHAQQLLQRRGHEGRLLRLQHEVVVVVRQQRGGDRRALPAASHRELDQRAEVRAPAAPVVVRVDHRHARRAAAALQRGDAR